MGYPPMNLTILQLPAPSSNMTKAEYKQAYGIDLDAIDIKAFRLVVFGNQKYAIDQIKEVEDGYEIYFNGRIMSITDIVQVSDEVYDVINSKPIYWHGISVYKTTGDRNALLCHILKNDDIAIDSIAKLVAWANSIDGEVLISCTGAIVIEGTSYTLYAIQKNVANQYSLFYVGASGYNSVTDIQLSDYFNNCEDSINKIN